jgi:hypothetical protein
LVVGRAAIGPQADLGEARDDARVADH